METADSDAKVEYAEFERFPTRMSCAHSHQYTAHACSCRCMHVYCCLVRHVGLPVGSSRTLIYLLSRTGLLS